jgi:ActR/RegA family two-component response regulator
MASSPELHGSPCPVLVLAHPDPTYTATVARSFRRLNWSVQTAQSADECRRVARQHRADLVVLAADLSGESGWLACEKLRTELPDVKVVLVADEPSAYLESFARFIGATALLSVHHAPAALLELVGEPAAV